MRSLKSVSLFLALIMVSMIFVGCGETVVELPEQIVETTTYNITAAETTVVVAPEQVAVLDTIGIEWISDDTLVVGEDVLTDEFDRIISIKSRYETDDCEYNDDGYLTRVNITNDDGSVGFEEWTYENMIPVSVKYDPNDGFHSMKDIKIDTKLDNDRIVELIENITYTDSEDGSVDNGVNKYEYEYGEDDRIVSVKYYSDGELDHVTKLTYDEDGNLTEYTNVDPENNRAYLSISFTYKLVDKTEVDLVEKGSFVYFYNFENLLNYIL
ncbi:MAG: hypothetical protein IJA60_01645 [Clostridia bacterium]|nr:hypothetical protein [Clostridia bacterium]